MLDLILLIGILAIVGTGYFIWKLRAKHGQQFSEAPARRREDARDWQRRSGADSLLAANFLQPTQNEILETLAALDHLTPGWEAGEQAAVEGHFLNELAVSFPSLRKPKCVFPLPFTETLTAKNMVSSGRSKRPVTEEEAAAQRDTFRTSRAQSNALEQIVAGSVGPVELIPGSLPFRVSAGAPVARAGNPWPTRLAVAAVIIAALLGASYFYDGRPGLGKRLALPVDPSPAKVPVTTEIVQATPASLETVAVAAVTPASIAEPAVTPSPVTVAAPAPAAEKPTEKPALNARIAVSQQRAIDKYPTLAIEGSEINLRFVFRYKNLVHENSPRLLDPNWPEQLAEECAAAATSSKRSALTQVTGARR